MIGDISDADLYSPGRSIARRQALETALHRALDRVLRETLALTRSYIRREVEAPPLAVISSWWAEAASSHLARAGLSDEAHDALLREALGSEIPGEVLEAASGVLEFVAARGGDADLLESLLEEALTPHAPQALTAAGWEDVLRPPTLRESAAIDAILDSVLSPPSTPVLPVVPQWVGATADRWAWVTARDARTYATWYHGSRSERRMRQRGIKRKMWVTRGDAKVRIEHSVVGGSLIPLDSAFSVGGYPMMFPGDPSAPIHLTINCRCVITGARGGRYA